MISSVRDAWILSGFYLMVAAIVLPAMHATCKWLKDMVQFRFFVGWCLFVGVIWNGAVWLPYLFL